jgi:hypothetical protein
MLSTAVGLALSGYSCHIYLPACVWICRMLKNQRSGTTLATAAVNQWCRASCSSREFVTGGRSGKYLHFVEINANRPIMHIFSARPGIQKLLRPPKMYVWDRPRIACYKIMLQTKIFVSQIRYEIFLLITEANDRYVSQFSDRFWGNRRYTSLERSPTATRLQIIASAEPWASTWLQLWWTLPPFPPLSKLTSLSLSSRSLSFSRRLLSSTHPPGREESWKHFSTANFMADSIRSNLRHLGKAMIRLPPQLMHLVEVK